MDTPPSASSPVKCGICRDGIQSATRLIGCTHIFCLDCITEWSGVSNTCPFCNARFTALEPVSTPDASSSSVPKGQHIPPPATIPVEHVDRRASIAAQMAMEEYGEYSDSDDIDTDDDLNGLADGDGFIVSDHIIELMDGTIIRLNADDIPSSSSESFEDGDMDLDEGEVPVYDAEDDDEDEDYVEMDSNSSDLEFAIYIDIIDDTNHDSDFEICLAFEDNDNENEGAADDDNAEDSDFEADFNEMDIEDDSDKDDDYEDELSSMSSDK